MHDSTPAVTANAAFAPRSASAFALRALAAPDPAIALWLCDLERDPASIDAIAACLSSVERARAARFGTAMLRNRWIVGRATLRLLLGSATGVDPADIRIARGVRGRPELVGPRRLDFNVSHTGGIALIYLASFVMSFFGASIPLIHSSGTFGILFSLAVVTVAALNLVLDFDFIEQGAAQGAPKYMEWYGAFGLMVTLVWLYLEILRLLAKLQDRR